MTDMLGLTLFGFGFPFIENFRRKYIFCVLSTNKSKIKFGTKKNHFKWFFCGFLSKVVFFFPKFICHFFFNLKRMGAISSSGSVSVNAERPSCAR
jgi:hypothetical protein